MPPKPDKNAISKMNFYAEKISDAYEQMNEKMVFEAWSVYELNERADILKSNYEKYELKSMHVEQENELDQNDLMQIKSEFKRTSDLYFKAKAKLQMRIDFLKANPNQQDQAEKEQLELMQQAMQKITLKGKFNGSFGEWFAFRDEVEKSLCNDTSKSDEDKMIIFIQACAPEVLNDLKANDFADAWTKLSNKYDNKYKLTQFYTAKICNLNQLDVPSPSKLNEFLTMISEASEAMEKIGDVKSETLLAILVETKLNIEMRRAWNRQRIAMAKSWAQVNGKPEKEFMPQIDDMNKFLVSEIEVYAETPYSPPAVEAKHEMGPSTSMMQAASKASNQQKQAFDKCVLCNPPMYHPLFKCPRFLAKSITDRVMVISEKGLCMKCFKAAHAEPCLDTRSNLPCSRCKPDTVYHNSTLCEKNVFTVAPVKQTIITSNNDDEDDWTT